MVHFLKIIELSLSALTKKMAGIDLFWPSMLVFSHLLLLLQPFSAVVFFCHFQINDAKPSIPQKQLGRILCNTNQSPARQVIG